MYFMGGSIEIFRGKSINRNDFDSQINTPIQHSFQGIHPSLMAFNGVKISLYFGKPSVTIHYYGHVFRHVLRTQISGDVPFVQFINRFERFHF
jgi:hypothetical protein